MGQSCGSLRHRRRPLPAYFQASSAFPAIFDNSNMCTDEWSASVYSPQGVAGAANLRLSVPCCVLDDDYNACIAARNDGSR